MFSLSLKNWMVSALPGFLRPHWRRIESSPLGYRLARGAFWSLAGTCISRGLGLCASVMVARMLGKNLFGELGIVQSTVGMFATFAGFGMGLTTTKYVAELRMKDPARAGRIIGLSSLVAWISGAVMVIVLLAASQWLAVNTLAAPHLGRLLRISSVLLLLGAVNGAQTGALAGFEAFKRVAAINFASGLTAFPLMVLGTHWGGIEGAILGLISAQGLNCLFNFAGLRAEARKTSVPLRYTGCLEETTVLWQFSVPALASGIIAAPAQWTCGAMLVNREGGYAEMGLFNAANQWFGALIFLPTILTQATLPVLSERLGQKNTNDASKVLKFCMRLSALAALPLVAAGSLASPYIMGCYGPGFQQGWLTLVVVLFTAALMAIQAPIGQVIAASGRMWLGALMNLGWATSFLLLTWLFLSWGGLGLATGRLGAYAVHLCWTLPFAYSVMKARSLSQRSLSGQS